MRSLRPMFYLQQLSWLNLKSAMILVGLLLIAAHALALLRPAAVQAWLKAFPRSREIGTYLLLIATIWYSYLLRYMDLTDFDKFRSKLLVAFPALAALTWYFVPEFLAVRALGMLALIAAEPVLQAAWMRPEWIKYPLVLLAYTWVGFALFWVGMPYTLRDQIAWVTKTENRFRLMGIAGLAYGIVLFVGGMTVSAKA